MENKVYLQPVQSWHILAQRFVRQMSKRIIHHVTGKKNNKTTKPPPTKKNPKKTKQYSWLYWPKNDIMENKQTNKTLIFVLLKKRQKALKASFIFQSFRDTIIFLKFYTTCMAFCETLFFPLSH